ncbi:heavy-metal-associated domain-containing protein [Pseudonocardia sp. Cha107L01]|jgi:copper chaperone CopZ|uniref:heavy-metal-associated domain-containing protein n=1 Tax=Pseudonocardia sp. Cha107L01 TaxID=3457576 RepID=UPI00403EA63B
MAVQAAFRTTVTVTGMTCEHCARSVTEELSAVNGVHTVEVTVSSGKVTISSDRELSGAEIASAVDTAGYSMAD